MNVSADVLAGMLLEITGDGTVAESAAGSKKVLGVAYANASLALKEKVAVITKVEVNLMASGTVTAGDLVKAGANSTVVKYVQGTDTEDMIVGKALSTGTGALVRVLLL